ncbi:MAG: haloacid dehalogenase [Actinobacteria bacterium]|nr:haloacid dehalogenase [Actinomycetota bacterium]
MNPDSIDKIRSVLDARFAAREKGITGSRKVIRASANGIRALHRGEWDKAAGLIGEAGALLDEISNASADHPEIRHAGFVSDAAKEYAEARITEAIFKDEPVPTFEDLGIDPVPYLHGLGEAVGEMRRQMLDLLRDEKIEEAEETFEGMDDIVDMLAEIDYPDGMTKNLRRTTDVSRSLVERSRSDLTATVVQERLREDLRK